MPKGSKGVLTLRSTGLLCGESAAVRQQTGWLGSRMTVVGGCIPPSRVEFDAWLGGEDDFFRHLYPLICHRPGINSISAAHDWFKSAAVSGVGRPARKYVSAAMLSDLQVRVDILTGKLPEKADVITEDNRERLIGAVLTPEEVLALFEADPDSDPLGRRLFFSLDYWQLESREVFASQPLDASVLALSRGELARGVVGDYTESDRSRLVRLQREDIQLLYLLPEPGPEAPCWTTDEDRMALINEALDGVSFLADDMHAVVAICKKLSLGFLKSLFQKVIRVGPHRVTLVSEARSVPALLVAIVCVVHILPLSTFNPYMGGLESGLSALFKRLAIICVEDAWPASLADAEMTVAWCMACAALAAADSQWVPPRAYLLYALAVVRACLTSRTVCKYDKKFGSMVEKQVELLKPGVPTRFGSKNSYALGVASYLFDHFLGGMDGDHGMLRDVGIVAFELATAGPESCCVTEMPISHCLDHHCATNLIYCVPAGGAVASKIDGSSTPLKPVFTQLFAEVTGLNPRRLPPQAPSERSLENLIPRNPVQLDFFHEIQAAQRTLWHALMLERRAFDHPAATTDYTFRYSYGYLAHLVGPRSILDDQRHKCIWMLGVNNPAEINIVRHTETRMVKAGIPSQASEPAPAAIASSSASVKRSASSSSLVSSPKRSAIEDDSDNGYSSEQSMDAVREKVCKLLRKGIDVQGLGTVRMSNGMDGLPMITVNDVVWDVARKKVIPVPTADWSRDAQPSDSLVAPRESMDLVNGVSLLRKSILALSGISQQGIQLAYTMLQLPTCMLSFPRPSRLGGPSQDGTGGYLTPIHFDAWKVCKCVADWSALLLCPRAGIQLSTFETPRTYLQMRIDFGRRLQNANIRTIAPNACDAAIGRGIRWFNAILEYKKYTLKGHQERALRMLCYRVVDERQRVHFLWMDFGSGKTMLALLFARMLSIFRGEDTTKMACMFVTSASAIDSVKKECDLLKITNVCLRSTFDMNRARHGNISDSCPVVFVTHDIAKSPEFLSHYANYISRGLLIIDEVHLCMGLGTQRTSAIQLMTNLAAQVLYMTATPLRTTREKGTLRQLVQQVSDIPCVTQDDFMVACSAITHVQVYDRVPIVDIVKSVETADNHAVLWHSIPTRLGGLSPNSTMDGEMFKAALHTAYAETDTALVEHALAEIAAGARPFVVGRTYEHCTQLVAAIKTRGGLRDDQIWFPSSGHVLTGASAGDKEAASLVCAVMPIHRSTGYSATHFNVRLRGVYPSNEADRSQMDARIARTGQPLSPIRMITLHCGLTSLIINRHLDVADMVRLMGQINAIKQDD